MDADYGVMCKQGFAHHLAGRLHDARQCYEMALRSAPPSPELSHNLGVVCRELGDLPVAKKYLETALRLRPDSLATLDELALVCQDSSDINGALACYERCLQIDPRHQRAFVGMGMAFSDAGWEEDAIQSFRTALGLDPANLEAINGLGVIYKRMGRYAEAMALFERAFAHCPNDLGLVRNRAMLLGAQGRFDEEIAGYLQVLACTPEDADAHFSLACAYLMAGRLPEGWQEYEYRWSGKSGVGVKPPSTLLPRWRGEPVACNDSALIIYAEQGFGDGIQFARYARLAAERFCKVRLHTRRPLLALFRRSFGAYAEVVADVLDETGFTHHCPLLSLPLAFVTTLETIPCDIPYLIADPATCAQWQKRLADESRLKVGIAWATGKRGMHKRSFELSPQLLAPLFESVDGVCWLSLNKEPLDEEQSALLAHQRVIDWSDELADFDDTAALVSALDLVISVDTATAHLAGALGKPVWLLNRAESEWRWLRERSDSPWYPTMRIFRQQQSRQWSPVLQEVVDALRLQSAENS